MRTKQIFTIHHVRVSPSVGVTQSGRGPKALGLILFLSLIAILNTGCGESSEPIQGTSTQTALENNEATLLAWKALLPAAGCKDPDVFLAVDGFSWKLKNGYDHGTDDIWEIREDCSLKTFNCGTIGYLKEGGVDFNNGIATFVVLGSFTPGIGCMEPGIQSCSYVRDGSDGLRISCHNTGGLEQAFP